MYLTTVNVCIKDLTNDKVDENLISIEKALDEFDKIIVNNKFARLLINGVNVFDKRFTKDTVIENTLYRVYDEENNLLGIGCKNDNGFKIEKLLIT